MMEKFYSKIQPDLLLHIIFRFEDFTQSRLNLLESNNFLQCAALRLGEQETFKPHKHITRTVTDTDRKAQESWVVMQGSVECVFYDIDDTILTRPVLKAGDASFTLHGGHTYISLEDNTFILEYKTGRYYGQDQDKIFI